MPTWLAKERQIKIAGIEIAKTPLLLPSFSSKGFAKESVRDIVKYAESIITDEILISAYDVHFRQIPSRLPFASAIFLDSGGYEASEEPDLSDPGKRHHKPKDWKYSLYKNVLEAWDYRSPTIIVSYDHPRAKTTIPKQIERAKKLHTDFASAGRELLIKTPSRRERYVNLNDVLKCKYKLSDFDVIGFTEKELGPSTLDRMVFIGRLRRELDAAGLDLPIHIFGSLDPIGTPLYFLAGADIFDGLTWLRYSYNEGLTLYKHNYGAIKLGIQTQDYKVDGQTWNNNYYYLQNLREEMRRFLHSHAFSAFKWHTDLLEKAYETLLQRLGA